MFATDASIPFSSFPRPAAVKGKSGCRRKFAKPGITAASTGRLNCYKKKSSEYTCTVTR